MGGQSLLTLQNRERAWLSQKSQDGHEKQSEAMLEVWNVQNPTESYTYPPRGLFVYLVEHILKMHSHLPPNSFATDCESHYIFLIRCSR